MSKHHALFSALVLFSALTIGVPAGAGQGRSQGQAKKAEKAAKHDDKHDAKHEAKEVKHDARHEATEVKHDARHDSTVAVDRDGHVRVIREYAGAGSLPPGLAKREALPPGLREQLRERGALPPGLQKRLVLVPAPLGARLPAVPPYYRRYFAGDDLIVVDTRTNRIVTVIRDVLR